MLPGRAQGTPASRKNDKDISTPGWEAAGARSRELRRCDFHLYHHPQVISGVALGLLLGKWGQQQHLPPWMGLRITPRPGRHTALHQGELDGWTG